MRFLSVGPPVSSSLPPAAQLPSRRWLRVIVLSRFHVRSSYPGTCTPFTTRPCWAHTSGFTGQPVGTQACLGPPVSRSPVRETEIENG
jgi:hypothetical protein